MINKQELLKYDENIGRNFYLAKREKIENRCNLDFRINDGVSFKDDKWDFNYLNINNRSSTKYRIYFSEIPEQFKYYVKMNILYRITRRKNSIQTCIKACNGLGIFISALVKNNITDVRLINIDNTKKFLDDYKVTHTSGTLYGLVREISMFVDSIQEIDNIDLGDLKDYLNKSSKELGSCSLLKAKNDYIPDSFLNQLVSLALKDIDNPDLDINYRIFACLLVILAETGMRIEELTLLETGKLDKLTIGDLECNYLQFLTFKIHEYETEYKATYSWMSDKATKAYEKCEEFVDKVIVELSEQPRQHLFYYFHTGKMNSRYVKKEHKEFINGLDKKTIEEINQKVRRYLWIDSIRGLHKTSTHIFREQIKKFMVRHHGDIDTNKIPNHDMKKIKSFRIKSIYQFERFFSVEERLTLKFDEVKEINFWYLNPHMFRVTVCTKLFMQGVHLDFIIRHLNHLSEDMTNYYNKSYELVNNLEESIRIISEISNEEGLIPMQSERNESFETYEKDKIINCKIEKINKFLKRNKVNIRTDIKALLKLMEKLNSILKENEFGICIRSVAAGLCERKKSFNLHMNDHGVGTQLETYRFFDCDYERFKQKIDILKHNERISKQDSRYNVEFEREQKSLKRYISHTLKIQLELIEKEICLKGKERIIKDNPNLKDIIQQFNDIKKEILEWI